MKISVLACANNIHFLAPVLKVLRDELRWDICLSPQSMGDLDSADVVWLEWADGVCINALMNKKPEGAKYILRLHRYELFTPRTINQLDALTAGGHHKKIDRLVFVSEFVRAIGATKFPWMAENSIVLPNLIDIQKFPFVDRPTGFNLLFLGRQSYVKNLPHMLHLFSDLYRMDSRYRLHVVGEISDPEIGYYAMDFVDKSGLSFAVTFHGRIEQPALTRFMRDMHYIVCTSIFESQGVGIIEAMATGMCPVVFNFPGAENIFPGQYLFLTAEEFLRRFIGPVTYRPEKYRAFVEDRFSVQNQIGRYANMIKGVTNG